MSAPPGYPLLAGVVVIDAPTAAWLVVLLESGRHKARADGLTLPLEVRAALDGLERLSAAHRGRASAVSARWMSTAEAAALLNVSQRRVVALLHEHKLTGRKRGAAWQVDAAHLILCLPSEPPITPESERSESARDDICA